MNNRFLTPPGSATWFENPDSRERYLATSRRRVLASTFGAALAASGGMTIPRVLAQPESTPTIELPAVCMLASELTEGPYYLDEMAIRQDITEGKAGVPLQLTLLVMDVATCTPLSNAAVEIWHCDALGFYSGFVNNHPGGTGDYQDDGSDPDTFLRGIQLTDEAGMITFQTIYPGWYAGRAVHIHLKVHAGGEASDGSYDGGHIAHTGQLAFADDMTERVELLDPYASKTSDWVRLMEDNIFRGVDDDEPTLVVDLTPQDDADVSAGLIGTITLGVDSSASFT